jgi:hypothetical protein
VRWIALELLVNLRGVGERGDLKPLLGEIARQQVTQPDIVVDDEDLGRGGFRCHVRGRMSIEAATLPH